MQKFLKTTTSLGLSLALSLPGTGFAQSAGLPSCNPKNGNLTFPCKTQDGTKMRSLVDLLEMRAAKQRNRVAMARTALGIAEADNISTTKEAEARADLEAAEERLANVEQRLADARAEAVNAPAVKSTDKLVMDSNDKGTKKSLVPNDDNTAEARDAKRLEKKKAREQARKQAEREARREAKRKERRKAKREAAAAATSQEESAQVFNEVLRESDVRSSSEEFDTNIRAEGGDSDGGLSKFEKALLLGLGAVAVGTILKNGDKVVSRSGDRVVVERDGELKVLKDDNALLRQPGNDVKTETFSDGSTRSTVTKPDGSRIVTIRSADGSVLRRVRVTPQGEEYLLFDDTREEEDILVTQLPELERNYAQVGVRNEEELRAALQAEQDAAYFQNRFSLRQVRDIDRVRALAPEIELDAVQFASGSAAILPEQARSLARIGNALSELIAQDPRTVILVEGHTDAVGDETYNLALSDRRAETVALALTEYFDVPPENMITQGYGETSLKVPTLADEARNRRAVVRNITQLLR